MAHWQELLEPKNRNIVPSGVNNDAIYRLREKRSNPHRGRSGLPHHSLAMTLSPSLSLRVAAKQSTPFTIVDCHVICLRTPSSQWRKLATSLSLRAPLAASEAWQEAIHVVRLCLPALHAQAWQTGERSAAIHVTVCLRKCFLVRTKIGKNNSRFFSRH